MKNLIRVIAVLMLAVMAVGVMAACGKVTDERLYASWKQTDDVEGNITWTFDKDGKFTQKNDDTGAVEEGTYKLEAEGSPKIYLKLPSWDKEKLGTYVCTTKVLDIECSDIDANGNDNGFSFRGEKQ